MTAATARGKAKQQQKYQQTESASEQEILFVTQVKISIVFFTLQMLVPWRVVVHIIHRH